MIEAETDDSASTSSEPMTSSAALSAKLAEDSSNEVDDEGFFDKPAVSPESGASTPPPGPTPTPVDTLAQAAESFLSQGMLATNNT